MLSQIQQVSWEQMYDCGLEKKDTTQNIPSSPGTKSVRLSKLYVPPPSVTIQRSQWVQRRKEHVKISVEYEHNPIEFQGNVKCTIVYIHNVPKVEPFSTSTSPKNETVLVATGSNKANDSIMKNGMNIRHKAKNIITDETKHSSELERIYNYINANITNLFPIQKNGAAILEVYTI